MIRTVALIAVVLLLLAVGVWVLDLCLRALFARLGVPDDVKTAARALIGFLLFAFVLLWLLSVMGVLPSGWW